MPSKVYINIEGHRLLDNKRVCEDVTKIGLPTITHPTTTISAAGMAVDVDMPNTTHLHHAQQRRQLPVSELPRKAHD